MRRVCAFLALTLTCSPAMAQLARKNPFSIGVNEGAVGQAGRLGLWLLRQQAHFYQILRAGVEHAAHNPQALFSLALGAFAYGVFHAAGPGHGKAVISSYMLANERAMKRGVALSLLAAVWQAIVAIVLVGVAAVVLGVTAQTMTAAAAFVEKTAFAAIAMFGAWLSWRKGAALAAVFQAPAAGFQAPAADFQAPAADFQAPAADFQAPAAVFQAPAAGFQAPAPASSRFKCDDGVGPHAADCPHCIAPDPKKLGENFSWRQGAATVLAAGSRPCSGAILVLVFSASLGAFSIGVWATLAMAAGTALTTSGLAVSAVLFKSGMMRLLGAQNRRAEIFGRAVEALAALAVLLLGLSLLLGLWASGG